MPNPTVDIIVPVWNSPFETRACLASILEHSPEVRLVVVDNGSTRETEHMLDEFSEHLGVRGLFITTERNIGLLPAINRGLAHSDSDVAVVVRPHVQVKEGWLNALLDASKYPQTGMVSPLFTGVGAPHSPVLTPGCSQMETFFISLSTLLIRYDMRMKIGGFDEGMDNGDWCLKDYLRRADQHGFRTSLAASTPLICGSESIYGSLERRQEQEQYSRALYLKRWGVMRHYVIYFGKETVADTLEKHIETLIEGARQGNRIIILLHRRQLAEFRRRGWNWLHTGIELRPLPHIFTQRSLLRQTESLLATSPHIIPVRGTDNVIFSGTKAALSFSEIAETFSR